MHALHPLRGVGTASTTHRRVQTPFKPGKTTTMQRASVVRSAPPTADPVAGLDMQVDLFCA